MIAELIPILTAILTAAPQLVAEVESIWRLVTSSTAPTADQQQAIDDALAAAHKALQES
jgi:anti-sigma factor ChrR (cupin superfamily)